MSFQINALALAALLPLAASAQTMRPDAGIDLEAILLRVGALENEVARLKPPAVTPAPPEEVPLDVSEPPFSRFDWTWMNGSNYQPASLLRIGPVTPTLFVDAAYAWQFSNPVDNTIFPTTTAARHSEFTLNLAYLGFELNGIDTKYGGPIGRLELQMGSYIATIQGQDATLARGSFLSNPTLSYVKQAGAGWHFHWRHGLNIEVGIFPSYIALESYVPQENWSYTHPFVSDFTPYYFSGLRTQLFFEENQKLEVWLVNGWQSFGRWHDALTGGYLYNVRHGKWLSLTHTLYAGQDQTRASDPNSQSFRIYSDNYVQALLFEGLDRPVFQRLALCLVADVGYEFRGPTAGQRVDDKPTPPNGVMTGASLTGRIEWTRWLMTTVRGDVFYDRSSAVVYPLPLGSSYSLPGNGSAFNPFEFLGGGFATTVDFRPSPWLVLRVEYVHRVANQPYFSGSGGITGPNGLPPVDDAARAAFSPDLRLTDDRLVANVTLRL